MRVRTTKSRRAGDASRRLDDEVVGAGIDGMSIGSVISTDHWEGPCDSYSQGPFSISDVMRRERRIPLNCGDLSCFCGEVAPVLWMNRAISVEPEECFGKVLRTPFARTLRWSLSICPASRV